MAFKVLWRSCRLLVKDERREQRSDGCLIDGQEPCVESDQRVECREKDESADADEDRFVDRAFLCYFYSSTVTSFAKIYAFSTAMLAFGTGVGLI